MVTFMGVVMSEVEEQDEIEEESTSDENKSDLAFIMDVPMIVSVELGRTVTTLKNVLQLKEGSVIELEKLAGEPLEVYINKNMAARGEVVVVNDKFGIRMTDIITPIERVDSGATKPSE